MNYALDRLQAALRQLDHPEKDVYTLVIGGTNGKGTVSLLISSSLVEAGFRVSTYLSPHLQHPRERFLFDLHPADEADLESVAKEFQPIAKKFELTYFEYLTLLMFVMAKRKGSDFLVLEVGLGGRLDATNVTDPIACAITNISYDHTALLGDTLPRILDEKMGILRPESLLFTGIKDPALLDRVEQRCLECDAIYYFSKELKVERGAKSWAGQSFTLNGMPFDISLSSRGALDNAALALLMMRIVFPRIPIDVVRRGFSKVRNPARLEVVSESPRVVISGDHNPAGIEDLLTTLEELKPERLRILCGFSPDKPYREMYAKLAALTDDIRVVPFARMGKDIPADYVKLGPYEDDARRAAEAMVKRADPGDTILITGSLYLAGEVRSLWRKEALFLADPKEARREIASTPDAATPAKRRGTEAERSPSP
jgi:dihydrofolate synthase/folylpolyglutamate synthase